ncbi:aminotransferase class I/II-fold pyridoxal phosphate-dependent enzyme [Bradyrhizobium erythrophlei]|uniref:aminotransferase class I/II-fold pyridoxal phosphate-dependent enzyme n=1 Tax=Bradyrhizobium erythrophlei TaxID=1437360 RepID=UPI0035EDB5DB
MQEFTEMAEWLLHQNVHGGDRVDSLPNPTFQANGQKFVSFSTNNYLSIATSARLISAAKRGLETYGVGNCESRLLGGNLAVYSELEHKLSACKKKDAAVLFATGYMANLGVLSTLPQTSKYARIYGFTGTREYTYAYFSDELNHVSLREGIRMSGAARATYRHLDLNHLEGLLKRSTATTKIIVTDGVFSQDGDIAQLPDLLQLAERYDATLYVDDAHGTGVFGEHGGGIAEHFGVTSERMIYMGTLSKAYGGIGGFIATEAHIAEIVRLACSAYGFSSTLPPDQAVALSEAVDMVVDEPERRGQLWDNQRYFVARMSELPYPLVSTESPIVPILVGDEDAADALALSLGEGHIHVDSVRFPAVPLRKARLRIQLNAGHTRQDIDRLIDALRAHHHRAGADLTSMKRMINFQREESVGIGNATL